MDLFSGTIFPRIPKSISVTLVSVLILNSLLFALIFQPQPAKAFVDPSTAFWLPIIAQTEAAQYTEMVTSDVKTTIFQAKETQKGIWEQFKSNNGVIAELVAGLLVVTMHQVLAKLTNDIVAWINGGGKGKIRVLQDPGKFLTDAIDEAGGVLAGAILNVDSSKLCNPDFLKLRVKAAFTGPYAQQKFDEKVSCTFTGMAEGLRKFKEDFTKGGWQSFIELSRKENNDIGILLTTAEEMNAIKSEKGAEAVTKMGIGKGYLAQEKCIITKTIVGGETTSYYASSVESGVQTGAFTEENADEAARMAFEERQLYGGFVGKNVEEVEKMLNNGMTGDGFKKWWQSQGGEITCKTVTPGEQISELANKALQAPIKALEDTIASLTSKLGTSAGSVLKPYVLAIAGAGINLMLNKGYGLITNAMTPQKKTRKTQRQVTTSLQEHTMLAQSSGTLAGTVTSFRSFLLKAMIDFNIFVGTASDAIVKMNILGRIPINKVETEMRGGVWYLTYNNTRPPSTTADCPQGYKGTEVDHVCNCDPLKGQICDTPAPDGNMTTLGNRVYTNNPGKVFFDEAKWCGAFSQEIAIPIESEIEVITAPLSGSNPILIPAASCPSGAVCSAAEPGWAKYSLDADATNFEMASRVIAYDDKQLEEGGDRFIRQNIVGADTNNDGIPDGHISVGTSPVTFEETIVNTKQNVNQNSIADDVSASNITELLTILPQYEDTRRIIDPTTGAFTTPLLQPGLAQAAVANTATAGSGYIFGGYNRFGFSSRILTLTGAFDSNFPVAIAGSTAVYYPPNGRIYIFGGFNNTSAYNNIWEFNPATHSVRSMSARLPAPATGLSAAYYPPNGRIYLFGGNNNGTVSDQILEYNQVTDSLITKNTTLPAPLAFAAAATAGTGVTQQIYIFGGIDAQGHASPAILKYDPASSDGPSSLARQGSDIRARGFLSAVRDPALVNADFINIYGGQNEFGFVSAAERYNTRTDSFVSFPDLPGVVSKAGYGTSAGGQHVLINGIVPVDPTLNPSAAKLFPQGDIYYIPARINSISITSPFWQKHFSPTFTDATVSLLNTRAEFAYRDFTATIPDPIITTITNDNGHLVWLSQPYPELYEKMQELMEKVRVINGYNYPPSTVKGYASGLADQLGMVPDDDPFDSSPANPLYQRGNQIVGIVSENNCIHPRIWDRSKNACFEEGYKGSITDVLTRYNSLTQTYQSLFAGLTDENTLEGVDKDFTILSPEETNIKIAMIGKRCPVLAPSATSSPDLLENCPKFGNEYNMARRFIFEADDTGANPTGLTTGFATNPFTGAKSSALAGLLNLDEMTAQLQALPPDKNIIKLIRLRQLLEQLQVSPDPIPVPGKSGVALDPKPLSGVDLIQVSLPGYEHIQNWLNATSTPEGLPDKNKSIQELITAYGYTNAKDAYPEISKQLDDIFDDIINQITDDLKETFLKRIDEQLEEAKLNAQRRLEKFVEYIRDVNPLVKLAVSKQRGDQLRGFSGANIKQISEDTSLIQLDSKELFLDNGKKINELLSRSPLRLTDEERKGIIGSAIYKIKTLNKFLGLDVSTATFAVQMAQYTDISGGTIEEYNANLDTKVAMVLKDVYTYYAGIYNPNDETLPLEHRDIMPPTKCNAEGIQYRCSLEATTGTGNSIYIYKDAKTKLQELKNDFTLMIEEASLVIEEFQTLFSDVSAQKTELEDFVKLLSTLENDYDRANACVGISTDELWQMPKSIAAKINATIGSSGAGMITSAGAVGVMGGLAAGYVVGIAASGIATAYLGAKIGAIAGPLGMVIGAAIGWFIGSLFGSSKKKKAKREAERREQERQNILNDCRAGVQNFNKHLGQLADTFVCGKINPKYED